MHWRDYLDEVGPLSPFNIIAALHEDGFSPFATRQNEHSVTHVLLSPVVSDSAARNKASSTRVWALAGGPKGIKSMQPALRDLEADYQKAVHEGFDVVWPVDDEVVYKGVTFQVAKGTRTSYETLLSSNLKSSFHNTDSAQATR